MAGGQVVDDRHRQAAFEQCRHQVAAHVTGPAGDQVACCHALQTLFVRRNPPPLAVGSVYKTLRDTRDGLFACCPMLERKELGWWNPAHPPAGAPRRCAVDHRGRCPRPGRRACSSSTSASCSTSRGVAPSYHWRFARRFVQIHRTEGDGRVRAQSCGRPEHRRPGDRAVTGDRLFPGAVVGAGGRLGVQVLSTPYAMASASGRCGSSRPHCLRCFGGWRAASWRGS